jgi:hypothetical protein
MDKRISAALGGSWRPLRRVASPFTDSNQARFAQKPFWSQWAHAVAMHTKAWDSDNGGSVSRPTLQRVKLTLQRDAVGAGDHRCESVRDPCVTDGCTIAQCVHGRCLFVRRSVSRCQARCCTWPISVSWCASMPKTLAEFHKRGAVPPPLIPRRPAVVTTAKSSNAPYARGASRVAPGRSWRPSPWRSQRRCF